MSNSVSYLKYRDVADFRNGLNFSKDSHGKGCLLIGVADFKDYFSPKWASLGEINPFDVAKEEDYLKKGDIIFVRSNGNKALVGRSLYIDRDVKSLFSGFCIRARPKTDDFHPLFLAYFSKTERFGSSINSVAGTNINNLNQNILGNVEIPFYSKGIQKSIVDVLSSIDKKIEINNRIKAELESMAKTLYDYWFVQFDFPDANGKPYKTSGGKMVYNATLKRGIPAGWGISTLWKIAKYTNGLAMQKYRADGDEYLPVIKIREMNNGISVDTERARLDLPKDVIINDGDVLFSWSATLDVKIWSQGQGALNQHIFKVSSADYPKSFYYFELLNYLRHFKMIADLRKTTMGHITLEHLKQAYICLPPMKLLKELDNSISDIFDIKIALNKENSELSLLRDWLLPLLMNGQVTVK
ncbi:hypothetical protein RC79_17775 [Pectobacterium brasiliense]|uniref:restriction endonuclease subunit S n=1 Tax=Pectobacterium TaxID=122277 RepID=UPI00057DFAC5|nr:restriction endonuclease subunit S [Pectobacterium brasiliense]KHS70063.1 hypothetical protein RC79_17775 [Pectobacterium brasiliense]